MRVRAQNVTKKDHFDVQDPGDIAMPAKTAAKLTPERRDGRAQEARHRATKKTFFRHDAREPFFGVKVGDLKTIQKKIKKDHALALRAVRHRQLGCDVPCGADLRPASDDEGRPQEMGQGAYWYMLSCYTVPWVASESRFGRELALEWMDSDEETIATAGWSTYGCLVAVKPDAELDLAELEKLLNRVKAEIGSAKNRVRYAMMHFVIAVGGYVAALTAKAKATAKAVGPVEVDMGDTSCQVPDAFAYISKIEAMGRVGKKRKTAMC